MNSSAWRRSRPRGLRRVGSGRRKRCCRGSRPRDRHVLRHDCQTFAQVVRRYLTRIDAIDRNTSLLRIVEAQQQGEHVILPAPDGPTIATVSPGVTLNVSP